MSYSDIKYKTVYRAFQKFTPLNTTDTRIKCIQILFMLRLELISLVYLRNLPLSHRNERFGCRRSPLKKRKPY